MKRIIYFLSVVILTSIMYSCDKKDPLGKWSDNIKLSAKTAEFSSNADSVKITTQGTWWWVCDITVNDTTYYNFEDINLESYNYSIQESGILVERRDTTTLFIKADANKTGAIRKITVGLEAGDYFDRVTVTQAAE